MISMPVNQPDYQTGYSNLGKQVGSFIESAAQVPGQLEAAKKFEEQMKDLKQFKTTMSNVANNLMGNDFSDDEKAAVQSEIQTSKDPREIASKLAELKTQQDIYKNTRQQYPNAVFPKPSYGMRSETYQKMIEPAAKAEQQKTESQKIGGIMGSLAQPITTQPEPQGTIEQQNADEMNNYQPIQSVPEQSPVKTTPKTQRDLVASMGSQGIDLGSQQAQTALKTIPTDNQTATLEQKKNFQEALNTYRKDVLTEKTNWDKLKGELLKARNSIQAGQKDDIKMLAVAKLIESGNEAQSNIDAKINGVEDDISRLKREKLAIKQKISDAMGDTSVEATFQSSLDDIDKQIADYGFQKEHYKVIQDDMSRNVDFAKNVMKKVSKKKGYDYNSDQTPKPTTVPQGTQKTKTGKSYSFSVE
jgi:hypothetical protein